MNTEQRPIKLRVWDPASSTLAPLTRLEQLTDPALTVSAFSGIYDADGREIWEGDITQWSHQDKQTGQLVTFYYVCRFRLGRFCLVSPDNTGTLSFETSTVSDRVIGNCYQHGDLLKLSNALGNEGTAVHSFKYPN